MNRRHVWARIAVVLDSAIALLLLLVLQIGSFDLRIVREPYTNAFAFGIAPRALFGLTDTGSVRLGFQCPNWEAGKLAAFIKAEHPWLLRMALALLFVKAFVTWFLVERPEDYRIGPSGDDNYASTSRKEPSDRDRPNSRPDCRFGQCQRISRPTDPTDTVCGHGFCGNSRRTIAKLF
jgi:hypothetical protein